MGRCKKDDTALIEAMKKAGALEIIQIDKAPTQDGAVVIACGDGEHTDDWLPHLLHTFKGKNRYHLLTLNGGPALIPKESKVATLSEGQILLEHNLGGRKLKEISTTILYAHWPCGAAGLAGVGLLEYLELCLTAKKDIKQQIINADEVGQTLLLMHVAFLDKKRSYRIHGDKMLHFIDSVKKTRNT